MNKLQEQIPKPESSKRLETVAYSINLVANLLASETPNPVNEVQNQYDSNQSAEFNTDLTNTVTFEALAQKTFEEKYEIQ